MMIGLLGLYSTAFLKDAVGMIARRGILVHAKLLPAAALALSLTVSGFAQRASLPELSLEQAIDQALRNNASLKKAKLDTSIAARDLAANQTKRFASVQLVSLGGILLTKPSITFSQGAFGSFPTTGPIPATDQAITIARKPVGIVLAEVKQPISTQYKLHLQLKGLSLTLEATREDERKQRLDVVDQVRRAYYDVVKARSELESSQKSLPYYQESKRLASESIKQEAILESELIQADVQLLKTQNSVSDTADQLAQASEKLNDLMGRDIHQEFRVSDARDIDSIADTLQAMETLALQQRPDVKKANLQVRMAGYDSRAKKAEYIPDVSLTFDYFTTTNFGNTLPSNITTAGLQLTWEPWDWGRRRQELAGKRLKEEQSRIAADATVRAALMEVRNAWRQLESARRKLSLSEVNQRAARQKLRETQEQVKVEKVLTRNLFSAEFELASADSQYQQALALFWSARADLKKATGEE